MITEFKNYINIIKNDKQLFEWRRHQALGDKAKLTKEMQSSSYGIIILLTDLLGVFFEKIVKFWTKSHIQGVNLNILYLL